MGSGEKERLCSAVGGRISIMTDGSRWIVCKRGFFLPVRVLSPDQARTLETAQSLPHRRTRQPKTPGNLARRERRQKSKANDHAYIAHGDSLGWHRCSLGGPKKRPKIWPAKRRSPWRDHPVTGGAI